MQPLINKEHRQKIPDKILLKLNDFAFEHSALSFSSLGVGLYKLNYGINKPLDAPDIIREKDLPKRKFFNVFLSRFLSVN
jgi:hypothetical protein